MPSVHASKTVWGPGEPSYWNPTKGDKIKVASGRYKDSLAVVRGPDTEKPGRFLVNIRSVCCFFVSRKTISLKRTQMCVIGLRRQHKARMNRAKSFMVQSGMKTLLAMPSLSRSGSGSAAVSSEISDSFRASLHSGRPKTRGLSIVVSKSNGSRKNRKMSALAALSGGQTLESIRSASTLALPGRSVSSPIRRASTLAIPGTRGRSQSRVSIALRQAVSEFADDSLDIPKPSRSFSAIGAMALGLNADADFIPSPRRSTSGPI